MGRNKERKSRLDKGSTGTSEFVGFGAFAVTASSRQEDDTAPIAPTLQWSPVYAGSDSQVSLLFKKISQKRDSVTKARALGDLEVYFSSQEVSRKEQVSAICHLLFVYHSKLNYDSSSAVRAAALSCLIVARSRIPKAWKTLWEQHPDLQGMVWCSRADPAAEVRAVAFDDAQVSQNGVCTYVTRILSYGRARNMHDALFVRKSDQGGLSEIEREQAEERYERIVGTALSGMSDYVQHYPENSTETPYSDYFTDGILWKTLTSSKSSFRRKTYAVVATLVQHAQSLVYGPLGVSTLPKQLVDVLAQEKDAINISPLLELLLLYLTSFPSGKSTWSDVVDVVLLCKHVNKMLRRACYGSSASLWGPTLLPLINSLPTRHGSAEPFHFQQQMLSSLWQGREATVVLGDMLSIVTAVAECSSFLLLRRQQDPNKAMEESTAKNIADFFLRALAQYLVMERVSSSYQDKERVLATSLARDLYNMEIASEDRSDCALFLVKTWFWDDGVRTTILDATGTEVNDRVTRLIECLTQEQGRGGETGVQTVVMRRLKPVLREKFHNILVSASGRVPDQGQYDVLIGCLKYCGARYVFDESTSENAEPTPSSVMEKFIMNDLLRWIVIHSSSLSTQSNRSPSDNLLKRDFTILRICLPTIPSPTRQTTLWESILREVVAAKCDLDLLATGISALFNDKGKDPRNSEWEGILRSNDIIDQVAIQAGMDTIMQFRDYSRHENGAHHNQDSEASHDSDNVKGSVFLHTCVGLSPGVRTILVGKKVIYQWIDMACVGESGELPGVLDHDDELRNPLLEILLSLISRGADTFSFDQVERLIMESWREGGSLWHITTLDLVLGNVELAMADKAEEEIEGGTRLCEQVVSRMSNELKGVLSKPRIFGSTNYTEIRLMCHTWSERAWRLVQLHESLSKSGRESLRHVSSLTLTGLADVDLWARSIAEESGNTAHYLYLCLIYLLERIEDSQGRLTLLTNCNSSVQLLVKIMLSLSGGGFFAAHNVMPSTSQCAEFLSFLGGRTRLPRSQVESWCHETVKGLASDMQNICAENCTQAYRGVSVLSELVGILHDGTQSKHSNELLPLNIKEGDMLWYIPDKEEDGKREKVQLIKVHYDDFPRLYFTVRNDSENLTERQTVADRLRMQPFPSETDPAFVLSEEEESRRDYLVRLIEEQLVRPFLSSFPLSGHHLAIEIAGECLNIVISQCGLPEKGGLGSTRYDIFKTVSSIDAQIVDSLSSSKVSEDMMPALLSLSSAMGFGRLTPASRANFGILRFSPENSVSAILDSYVNLHEQANSTLDAAVLAWLTVAVPSLAGSDLYEPTVTLMHMLGIRILERQGEYEQNQLSDSLLVLRAASDALRVKSSNNVEGLDSVKESENEVYLKLIESFTTVWESGASDELSYTCIDFDEHRSSIKPAWHWPFSTFLQLSLPKTSLVNVGRRFGNELIEKLYDSTKRWFSFRILHAITFSNEQLRDGEDSLSDGTRHRLKLWQDKLHQEEAEELEADILVVHRWLPDRLMNELESWSEVDSDVSGNIDDLTAMGQMLCWLCFLSFLDGAAVVNATNRGAFSSYIHNCGAVRSVISTALSYANIDREKSTKSNSISVEEILTEEDSLEVSKVSKLVLFRTVEVLPTIFKDWWTDECPKSLSTPVSQFVQNQVAPETLKRELARIKKATILDGMSVTGSCVSREVAASYVQDECQLSIIIQVPPNFPLRNVEVDGQKTLGIPEKRWKRWALQIRLMLNNQDGTILDALMLWKENVDKEFEGVEPCPVCYSVLSVKSHELPKLECKTCNNRFHSACLYKWFHSSGKSQCVLCQQPWSGTRVQ